MSNKNLLWIVVAIVAVGLVVWLLTLPVDDADPMIPEDSSGVSPIDDLGNDNLEEIEHQLEGIEVMGIEEELEEIDEDLDRL